MLQFRFMSHPEEQQVTCHCAAPRPWTISRPLSFTAPLAAHARHRATPPLQLRTAHRRHYSAFSPHRCPLSGPAAALRLLGMAAGEQAVDLTGSWVNVERPSDDELAAHTSAGTVASSVPVATAVDGAVAVAAVVDRPPSEGQQAASSTAAAAPSLSSSAPAVPEEPVATSAKPTADLRAAAEAAVTADEKKAVVAAALAEAKADEEKPRGPITTEDGYVNVTEDGQVGHPPPPPPSPPAFACSCLASLLTPWQVMKKIVKVGSGVSPPVLTRCYGALCSALRSAGVAYGGALSLCTVHVFGTLPDGTVFLDAAHEEYVSCAACTATTGP